MYFPKDFDQKDPVQSDLIFGQFHADEHGMVNFPTEFEFGYNASYRHGLVVRHSSADPAYDDWRTRSVIPEQELRGRWHDIQVNAFWRSAKDGYFRVYVDDRLAYDFTGPTIQGQQAYFKLGIYRLYTEPPTSPNLVVYYDRIWAK